LAKPLRQKKIFGSVPQMLLTNIKALEKIRSLRNAYAHGFGRDLVPAIPSQQAFQAPMRISERQLTKSLNIISKIAASVDRMLLGKFIVTSNWFTSTMSGWVSR
jgi:hypothetical protein